MAVRRWCSQVGYLIAAIDTVEGLLPVRKLSTVVVGLLVVDGCPPPTSIDLRNVIVFLASVDSLTLAV